MDTYLTSFGIVFPADFTYQHAKVKLRQYWQCFTLLLLSALLLVVCGVMISESSDLSYTHWKDTPSVFIPERLYDYELTLKVSAMMPLYIVAFLLTIVGLVFSKKHYDRLMSYKQHYDRIQQYAVLIVDVYSPQLRFVCTLPCEISLHKELVIQWLHDNHDDYSRLMSLSGPVYQCNLAFCEALSVAVAEQYSNRYTLREQATLKD
jgi:uncharacterized membrane protein